MFDVVLVYCPKVSAYLLIELSTCTTDLDPIGHKQLHKFRVISTKNKVTYQTEKLSTTHTFRMMKQNITYL